MGRVEITPSLAMCTGGRLAAVSGREVGRQAAPGQRPQEVGRSPVLALSLEVLPLEFHRPSCRLVQTFRDVCLGYDTIRYDPIQSRCLHASPPLWGPIQSLPEFSKQRALEVRLENYQAARDKIDVVWNFDCFHAVGPEPSTLGLDPSPNLSLLKLGRFQ